MYNSGNSSKNVRGSNIIDGTVETVDIADDAVTVDKLANAINTDIATGVSGSTTAGDALPKAGGTMTGTIAGFTSTGIDDNATSTAITIDASEDTTFTGKIKTETHKPVWIGSNGFLEIDDSRPSLTMRANGGNGSYGDVILHSAGRYGGHYFKTGIEGNGSNPVNTRMQIGWDGLVTINTTNLVLGGGNLVIGTSGKGIDFSATDDGNGVDTSSVLDDYEEGTWTPALSGSVTAGSTTYLVQVGRYEKIGRQVTIRGRIAVNLKGTLDGDVSITGLPYTSSATSGAHGILNFGYASNLGITASESLTCLMGNSATTGVIRIWNATTGTSNLDDSEIGNAISLYFEGSYHVD